MEDDHFVECPYNQSHKVLSSRIQGHLVKCEKKYPPLAICPYNATHRMESCALEAHLRTCQNASLKKFEIITSRENRGLYIPPNLENDRRIISEEYWD